MKKAIEQNDYESGMEQLYINNEIRLKEIEKQKEILKKESSNKVKIIEFKLNEDECIILLNNL